MTRGEDGFIRTREPDPAALRSASTELTRQNVAVAGSARSGGHSDTGPAAQPARWTARHSRRFARREGPPWVWRPAGRDAPDHRSAQRALWRAGRGVAGAGADQGQALRGRPRSLPIDFCLRIVPRGRPRHGPLGLPGTVGVITAIPWRSYTDCNRRAGVRRASGPALPQWPGPEGDTDARAVGACHVSVRLRPEHWLGLPAPENGCGPRPWTDVSSSCGAEIWAPCQDRVRSVTRNHEDGRRLWGPAVFRVTREPRPLPQSVPLTFTSETGGKHLLVGRGLMVATRDSTAMFSAARDGLGAGTTSSALSAP